MAKVPHSGDKTHGSNLTMSLVEDSLLTLFFCLTGTKLAFAIVMHLEALLTNAFILFYGSESV